MSHSLHLPHFFVIRTPLLPYATVNNLSAESLKEIYQQPLIQEALYIASPDLHKLLKKWLANEVTDARALDKLLITLTKYLLRMSYRCTPFGLFAGISMGHWGEAAQMEFPLRDQLKRRSRLDMDFLCALVVALTQQPDIRKQLRFYPNNTIYLIGDKIRYVEYRMQDKSRVYHLTHVEASDYIIRLLDYAKTGKTPHQLAQFLSDEEISYEEAGNFVSEVIDSQLLVSELEPVITGKDYAEHILHTLDSFSNFSEISALQQITKILRQLDKHLMTVKAEREYKDVSHLLKTMQIQFDPGQLVQVDMFKPTRRATLPASIATELQPVIALLAGIRKHQELENLRKFKEAFQARYENRKARLMEVLDAESGIGYPVQEGHYTDTSPLLENILAGKKTDNSVSYRWTDWQKFLLDQYLKIIQNQQTELLLTDENIHSFTSIAPPKLAYSLYTMCSVLAPGLSALNEGAFQIYYRGTQGPSAANLLGRFCHLDADLQLGMRQLLQDEQEQYPNAILAEIVHISQARIGNISSRPVLRDYEIPIMVQPGVDQTHTISLSDLYVSVQNNRIVLYSERLNKEIIPRLSSAHNYTLQALPYYHFLCDLQFQDTLPSLRWDWGALKDADFLPRVAYGKVILSLAQWVLHEKEIQDITNSSEHNLIDAIATLRLSRKLPRYITVSEGDNELPIDLGNQLSLKVLQQIIRKRKKVTLEENIFSDNNLFMQSPEGYFTHECILPWQWIPPVAPTVTPSPQNTILTNSQPVARSFPIGSEWLYFKIYCGIKTADTLITEVLKPLADQLIQEQEIDSWFFIRYTDPHHHLRVRFHGKDRFYSDVIAQVYASLQPYLHSGLVSTIQTDTYQRELERYGYATILESEQLFYYDSESTASILAMLEGDEGQKVRWQLALRGIDCLLNDFGYSLPAKKELAYSLQESFKIEFDAQQADARKLLAQKYRLHKAEIEKILCTEFSEQEELAPALVVFKQRSQRWKQSIETILLQHLNDPAFLKNLVSSHIHMFVNRFCSAQQRMHELVLYDLLYQYYTGALAREQKNKPT